MLVEAFPPLLGLCGWAVGKCSWLQLLNPYLSLYGGAGAAFSESLGSLAAVAKARFIAGMGKSLQKFSALRLELALLGEWIPAVDV